jgi:hypothetical protein
MGGTGLGQDSISACFLLFPHMEPSAKASLIQMGHSGLPFGRKFCALVAPCGTWGHLHV